jgi:hypothetical protein
VRYAGYGQRTTGSGVSAAVWIELRIVVDVSHAEPLQVRLRDPVL